MGGYISQEDQQKSEGSICSSVLELRPEVWKWIGLAHIWRNSISNGRIWLNVEKNMASSEYWKENSVIGTQRAGRVKRGDWKGGSHDTDLCVSQPEICVLF